MQACLESFHSLYGHSLTYNSINPLEGREVAVYSGTAFCWIAQCRAHIKAPLHLTLLRATPVHSCAGQTVLISWRGMSSASIITSLFIEAVHGSMYIDLSWIRVSVVQGCLFKTASSL